MKINNSTKYALMAVGYITTHPQDGNIMSQTIAEQYNISSDFLLNTLQHLCMAGILQSKRGPRGGFTMGRDPSEITMLEIIEAIEGSTFDRLSFIEHYSNEPFIAKMKKVCKKALTEQNKILSKATLADMVEGKKSK